MIQRTCHFYRSADACFSVRLLTDKKGKEHFLTYYKILDWSELKAFADDK